MKLYHGTSSDHLDSILKHGLQPRGQKKGNWKEFPSRPDMVYLTTTFAPYFATMSGGNPLIVEIDLEQLDKCFLYPDEDYISALCKAAKQKISHETIRQKLWRWQQKWTESVEMMGNCCYKGTIPPSAFTRYVKWDHQKLSGLSAMIAKQTVNVSEHLLLKPFRIGLIAWFFGDEPMMYRDPEYQPLTDSDPTKEQIEETIRVISAKRESIEIVDLKV